MKIIQLFFIFVLPALVKANNICGASKNDCHRFATCLYDTAGKYACECNDGYEGDGQMCTAMKICGTDKDDCHEMATCVDSAPGAFTCTCNEGYTGDGKTCTVAPADPEQCKKMDIIFVVDRSGSIKNSDYVKMRTFLELVGRRLRIGERNEKGEILGQAAIITFSEVGTLRLSLKESLTPGSYYSKITDMPGPEPGGRTRTALGLKVAESMTTREAGLRIDDPEVNKIFMVITDGQQTDEVEIKKNFVAVDEAMKYFHKLDMDVFVVGVGLTKQVAIDEIRSMVTKKENAITVENYAKLTETVEQYIQRFCPVPKICGTKGDDCSKDLATCKDTGESTYDCICMDGYLGNGKTCMTPYICGSKKDDCHPKYGICSESGVFGGATSYSCSCREGFTGDGKKCEEIDTCAEGNHNCHKFAKCISYGPGSYECECLEGYKDDGKACVEIDRCKDESDDCHEFATCTSTGPGTFECDCNEGYTGDGKICTGINGCEAGLDNCHEFATCTSTGPGTIKCDCNQGYTGDGKICTGIDICNDGSDDCHEFATCTSTGPGTFKCDCNQGYTGDGKTCKEINVCDTGSHDCHEFATCTSTGPGTYKCDCNQGYTGDGKMCTVIDICKEELDDCHEFATCTSTGPGTFKCDCIQGYTGDGKMCRGIDGCKAGLDDCHEFATCTSTGPGTFKCDCIQDYTGDGKMCTGIDGCKAGLDDCHEFATCTSTGPGTFKCDCIQGYTGDGKMCQGIDVCAVGSDDCHEFATCTPTGPGTFKCDCNEGYTGDGKTCTEKGVCNEKTDAIFVIDRSAGIRPVDYEKVRNFVAALGKKLQVGIKDKNGEVIGQAAVILYSEIGERILSLSQSTVTGSFENTVKQMPGPLAGGRTRTTRGLKTALDQVVAPGSGLRRNRKDVNKVVIVISNGAQTLEFGGAPNIARAVVPLLKSNVDVVAVGIDMRTSRARKELYDMASEPQNAIVIEKFDDLEHNVDKILNRLCPKPMPCGFDGDFCHKFACCQRTYYGTKECVCKAGYSGDGVNCKENKCNFDIGFLIDSSASLRDCNYDKEKDLVKKIAETFGVGQGKSQASVILYSTNAVLKKSFSDIQSLGGFQELINNLPLQGGGTQYNEALELAITKMFTKENGMRGEEVPKLLFLLTDGYLPSKPGCRNLAELADSLKEKGITIVAIGAGEADRQQLRQVVDTPTNLIMVRNFEDANNWIEELPKKFCPGDSCQLAERTTTINYKSCFSEKPTTIRYCNGDCVHGSFLYTRMGFLQAPCRICKPLGQRKRSIVLSCPGNRKTKYTYKEPTACVCQVCPWKRQ